MIKLVLLFKLSTFEFLVEYFISITFLRQIPINSLKYTAISRKVVARDNLERGGFEFTVFQRNLKEWQERPGAKGKQKQLQC